MGVFLDWKRIYIPNIMVICRNILSNKKIKVMTPREKAEELYLEFSNAANSYIEGKKCALIAVNVVIGLDDFSVYGKVYWQEVRKEIKKL